MELLTEKTVAELLNINQTPCLSLYLPTYRKHPENLQDSSKFKALVKELEDSLLQEYSASETETFLAPYKELVEDFDFWQHTTEGLAVFSTNGFFKVIGLQSPVEELTVVADSFHTKPLRKYLQSIQHYQILGVSLREIQLLEGNRYSLHEIELAPGIPKTIEDALGDELTGKSLSLSSGGVGNSPSIRHGQGGKSDEIDKDTERFFTVVSKAIYENYSKLSGLPLILAALPEHHNLFHKVSNNPFLVTKGITINPKSVSIDELVKLAWEVMEPYYYTKLDSLGNQFKQAQANGEGSDQINEVARAAAEGRVDTLLLEADRIIPGKLVKETGIIETDELQSGEVYTLLDDLLDDIGELVSQMGGKVVIVPIERMPTNKGIAAIYRYSE